jgi:hypothetical protein
VIWHVDWGNYVPTLGQGALPCLLGGCIGSSGVVLTSEGAALVVLLLMDLVPLTHGVGVSVMLRVVVMMEQIRFVPNLSLWTVLVGHGLWVAQFRLLNGCGYERLVLKFSFFCLLVLNRLLHL